MSVSFQTNPSVVESSAAVPSDFVWRLSVEQYHQMIQTGILGDDDAIELLEGWLAPKMPRNPRHRVATQSIREAVEQFISDGWYVDTREPITLETSEPEPDVTLVRGEPRSYLDHHPGPTDIALVVEVADSSLLRDRTTKKRLYAAAGIPVYWIANLSENCFEVYSQPVHDSEVAEYRKSRRYVPGEAVPRIVEGVQAGEIPVSEMLP